MAGANIFFNYCVRFGKYSSLFLLFTHNITEEDSNEQSTRLCVLSYIETRRSGFSIMFILLTGFGGFCHPF